MLLYPASAAAYTKKFVKNMNLLTSLKILNDVNRRMWMAAPFRWTVGSSPVINLSANVADYMVDYPDDWLYGISAILTDTGDMHKKELDIVNAIPNDIGYIGSPTSIAYQGRKGEFGGLVRINPIPPQIENQEKIIGIYKKVCPEITAKSQYDVPIVFPDEWFPVFQDGVLWRTYLYADDRRAGGAVSSSKGSEYSGQRAEFEAGLNEMKMREKVSRDLGEAKKKDVNI